MYLISEGADRFLSAELGSWAGLIASAIVVFFLAPLQRVVGPRRPVVLDSDRKPLYGRLGNALFPGRLVWRRHDAAARRDRANPLFPINHTNARLRHFLSRLRRRTWCGSRCRPTAGDCCWAY